MARNTSTGRNTFSRLLLLAVLGALYLAVPRALVAVPQTAQHIDYQDGNLKFYVVNDARDGVGPESLSTCEYFPGTLAAMRDIDGAGDLLVSPGDMTPLSATYRAITTTLGPDYLWYPGVGNHEFPGEGEETTPGDNLAWIQSYVRQIPDRGEPGETLRAGPPGCPDTTYSFDYAGTHFVILNVYCDESGPMTTHGDVPDHLYDWLAADLQANALSRTFVFGHEPAYPQRDAENGRARHASNCLNAYPENRDRFWQLLADHEVTAYFSGHTHSYSAVRISGVWQINTGHAAGLAETGTRSTFVRVIVSPTTVNYETYRQRIDTPCDYELTDVWTDESRGRELIPTPVVTPTRAPRGLMAAVDAPGAAVEIGLALLAIVLLVGTLFVIVLAIRAGRPSSGGTENRP